MTRFYIRYMSLEQLNIGLTNYFLFSGRQLLINL